MSACRELEPELTVTDLMIEVHADALKAMGMPPDRAYTAARRIVDQLLSRLGGGWFYLPRGLDCTREARQARNTLIIEMFRQGKPMRSILQAFHIKRAMFYRIINSKSTPKAQE